MERTLNLYGHELDLVELEDDEIPTDVIVIARTVRHTEDGRLEDAISISTTRMTTGLIQRGMIHEALDCLVSGDE